MLALSINLKLVPLILAPVWVIGVSRSPVSGAWRPFLLGLVARGALFMALTAAVFLPFHFAWGSATFDFLHDHGECGIEIESVHGSVLMGLQLLGHDARVYGGHGGVNIGSPLADWFSAPSPLLVGGSLLALTAVLLVRAEREGLSTERADASEGTLAQAHPHVFVTATVLFLLVAVSASKVLSAQYLVWFVPLVPLLPLYGRSRWFFFGVFILTCLLTTVIFPFLWHELTGEIEPGPRRFQGATPRGALVLMARNVFFLCLRVTLSPETMPAERAPNLSAGYNGPHSLVALDYPFDSYSERLTIPSCFFV